MHSSFLFLSLSATTLQDQATDLEESLKSLKSYIPHEYYVENSYVDAMDSYSTWRVGKIMEVKDKIVKVNFDGWSHKWDEQFLIHGSKIAPFKKFTPPYTGGAKSAIRDFDFDTSQAQFVKTMDQLENMANEGFLLNNPHLINQTVRGEHYVFVDAVLSLSNPVRTTKELKMITSLMEKYVEFFVKYLEIIPAYMKDYLDGRALNPLLYLVNEKIAAVSCFPEVFDTVNKLFGGNARCMKLYQNTEFSIQQYPQHFATKPRDKYSAYHNQAVNLVNYFGQLGGFEKLLQLLKWESKSKENSKTKPENEKESVLRFPIHLYKYVLPLTQALLRLLSSSIRDKFFGEFKTIFFTRMEKLTLKEMKENESFQGLLLIRESVQIFEEIYGKEAWMIAEQAELEFTLKMLKSPFLERKIKAMNEFKEFIDRADPSIEVRKLGDKKPFKYITQEKLKNWLIQQQVIEYILGDETHVELLKRSSTFFNFLCQTNGLSNEYLNLLWKSSDGKYEDYVRAVYDNIVELSGLMSIEALEFMFSRIASIPMEEYTEMTISLIKEYSLKAMNSVEKAQSGSYFKTKKISNPKYEYFGLRLFWEAIQDSSKLDPKLFQLAFEACAKLLKTPNFKNEREKYLVACFENLKENQSVPQSLLLSLHILTTFTGTGLFGMGNSLEDILQKMNSKYNLIELTVSDFEVYMKEVVIAHQKLKAKNALTEKPVYVGKNNHTYNIEHRLLFIENINFNLKKPELTFNHLKRLWHALVKNAVSEIETNAFLTWLIKSKETSSRQKTYCIGDTLLKQVFSNILCNPQMMDNFTNINIEIFKCFEKFFEIINEKEEYLDISKNNSYRVHKFDHLIGVEIIWQMLLVCTDEKVLKNIKHLIVALHLRITGTNIEAKLNTWQTFVARCVENLQIGIQKKNPLITLNVITVLHSFIVNFEGKKFLHKDSPNPENISLVVAVKNEESSKKTLSLPSNATLFYLRKRIAEEFNLPLYDFEILLRDNFKISNEIEEEYTVSAIASKDKDSDKDIIITPKPSQSAISITKDKFKTLLGSNQKLMDTLFDLLSSNNLKVANDTWDLLSILPPNKSLKTAFEKLNIENENAWFKLIELSCTKKFLYSLQILSDICSAPNGDQSKKDAWCLEFIDKKGFDHLMKLFDKLPTSELKDTFSIKAMATLTKLIGFFIDKCNSRLQLERSNQYNITDILNKLLQGLLTVTSEPSKEKKEKNVQKDNERVKANEEFVHNSFWVIISLIKIDPSLINGIYGFSDLRLLIQKGLIESTDSKLREDMTNNFASLSGIASQFSEKANTQKFNSFLLGFLIKNYLGVVVDYRDKCEQFFSLIDALYCKSTTKDLEATSIDFKGLALDVMDMITKLTPYEVSSTGERDYLLQGLLRLLELLFRRSSAMKNAVLEDNASFLLEVVHVCLFEIPEDYSPAVVPAPKCKTVESRKAAFQLLNTIFYDLNDRLTETLVGYLFKPLRKNFWRTGSYSDWYIFPVHGERSRTGYVGLKNLGCTCYMNSLMQQFYMLPAFRESLLETENTNVKTEDHENLLLQFQLIMASLKRSQKQYYDPRSFCLAFKDYEGKPINVVEQMDVDEFFNNLLDKLEPYLKGSKNEGIIKRIYGGMLSNQLICKGCPHSSEREEPCLAISLKVKNKKNIYEGLQNFIQGDMLEGDNAYYCEKCEKKIPTLKRVCVKTLPNILMLVLKRFEFDFDTMQRMKVNDYCEFPEDLDMRPYTQGYLRRKEKEETGEALDENDLADQAFPPQYYQYKLRGVVIHVGTAESGHYYSLIKDGSEKWFEFNDNIVRPFYIRDLADEAFGGEEKMTGNLGSLSKSAKEKHRNAYLLFYERVAYFDDAGKPIKSLLMNENSENQALDVMPPKILQEIRADNYKFQMTKYMFDRDYSDLIQRVLKANVNTLEPASPNTMPKPSVLNIGKLSILYFMTVILRARDRDRLPQFLKEVKKALAKYYELSNWLLNSFREIDIIKEFLVHCQVPDMKYFTTGLIKLALETVYQRDSQQSYEDFKKNSAIVSLTNSFVYVLYECEDQYKMMPKLFEVFSILAGLGTYTKNYLLEQRMIGRIIYVILNQKVPNNTFKDYRELVNLRALKSDDGLGDPTKEDASKKHLESIKSVGEMIDKKKEKMMLENLAVNFNSLVATVAKLGLSIAMPGMSNEDGSFVQIAFDDSERTILYSIEAMKALLKESNTKNSRKLVSSLIAHVSFKKESFLSDIIKMLYQEMNARDDQALKVYLITLEKLMSVQDGLEAQRVEKGMQCFIEVMRDNAEFYKATDMFIDYCFKMCSRNPAVLKYASESKTLVKLMDAWIRDFTNPLQGLSTQKIKLFKKRQGSISTQMLSQNSSKFTAKMQDRQAKLKKILKNDPEDLGPEYDSDEDYSDHKFELTEKLDYNTDGTTWVSAIVNDTLDEMLSIKTPERSMWVYVDDDRIAPFSKMQLRYKNEIDFYR